jgi:hypothetical protein
MRRVPLVAMLLVLCSLAVLPARAATDEGIVLRGSRTAYVDLYVYASTTITPADIRMSTRGSYVGFYMSPAPADDATVGALVMPRVGATGATSADVMTLGAGWDVRAGKYRVFLLTDGPATVFVPIQGQGYRGWMPARRAPFSVRGADFNVAPGSAGERARFPVSVATRSLIVTAGVASSESLTAVDTLDACVTTTAACDVTYAVSARLPGGRAWTYGAALVPAGGYAGVIDLQRLGGVDAGSHVDAAVAVLTIGVQS